jgi:DNA (cytosine-5)-methyltransferase 1
MNYVSVCSGIEACSVAWKSLKGWKLFGVAEIAPFQANLLKAKYPKAMNWGDFTKIPGHEAEYDLLVGGTPCQSYSVAGSRGGKDDPRGNLAFEFVRLADRIDTGRKWRKKEGGAVLWENVPGVLTMDDNAFGCFVADLAGVEEPFVGPRKKPDGKAPSWTDCGFVVGPRRAVVWRVLNARHFGVAQRRSRVFVFAAPAANAQAVLSTLIEGDTLLCEAHEPAAGAEWERRAKGFAHVSHQHGCQIVCYAPSKKPTLLPLIVGSQPADPVRAVLADVLQADAHAKYALSADGCQGVLNRSERRAKSMPPLLRWVLECQANGVPALSVVRAGDPRFDGMAFKPNQSSSARSDGVEIGVSPTLETASGGNNVPAVLEGFRFFKSRDFGEYADDAIASTVMAQASTLTHRAAVESSDLVCTAGDVSGTLCASGAGLDRAAGQGNEVDFIVGQGNEVVYRWRVRRLTPTEAERLQGFKDGWTDVPFLGKPASDTRRYSAIGNSMAVPVMRWIGERIEARYGEHRAVREKPAKPPRKIVPTLFDFLVEVA